MKTLGRLLSTFLILSALVAVAAAQRNHTAAGPSRVVIESVGEGWRLLVNGAPFFVKGIGCNDAVGWGNVDFLQMAKQMGANTVRTWYPPVESDGYLPAARKHGLYVNVGIAVPAIRGKMTESYTDGAFRAKVRDDALAAVRRLKSEPALLAWTVGNETIAFTEKESEKVAAAAFLADLVQEIKKEDENHPVFYACAASVDFPYIAQAATHLDGIALNVYGGLPAVAKRAREAGFNKPLLVSEFGAAGAWDQPKDRNGLPYEPLDQFKARDYEEAWRQVLALGPQSLGGIAFVLGYPRNQDSLDWFNVNAGRTRRQSYWSLYELYTGKKPKNRPPVISQFQVTPSSGVTSGDTIEARTKVRDPDGDKIRFTFMVTKVASDPVRADFSPPAELDVQTPSFGVARLTPRFQSPGQYRVNVYASDGHRNVAVATQSLIVLASTAAVHR